MIHWVGSLPTPIFGINPGMPGGDTTPAAKVTGTMAADDFNLRSLGSSYTTPGISQLLQ